MTVTVAGVVALQPSVGGGAHLCEAIARWKTSASPRLPSIATSLSSDLSTLAAG